MILLFGGTRRGGLLIDGGSTVPPAPLVGEGASAAAALDRATTILRREGRLFRDLHARARDEAAHAARTILQAHGAAAQPLIYVPDDDDAPLVVHDGTAAIARDEATRRVVRDALDDHDYVDRGIPSTLRPT